MKPQARQEDVGDGSGVNPTEQSGVPRPHWHNPHRYRVGDHRSVIAASDQGPGWTGPSSVRGVVRTVHCLHYTVMATMSVTREQLGAMSDAADVKMRDVPDELVVSAVAGDREAIERVLIAIQPLVVRYCRARLGRLYCSSVASVDDIAQEVCMAVLQALPGYRLRGRPFMAFVYGIAGHKVIDAHRAAGRHRAEPVAEVPDVMDVRDGPEQRALRAELSGRLAGLLAQLTDVQRKSWCSGSS